MCCDEPGVMRARWCVILFAAACHCSQLDDFYAELKWEFHTWGKLGVVGQSVLCVSMGGPSPTVDVFMCLSSLAC